MKKNILIKRDSSPHTGLWVPAFRQAYDKIEAWFSEQWALTPPPLYCSVDLRYAGFKLAPVDTNLFAAGFNHLHPDDQNRETLSAAWRAGIARVAPHGVRVLCVVENHTRNKGYIDNVHTLVAQLERAGFEVVVGCITARASSSSPAAPGLWETVVRTNDRVHIGEYYPDVVLLNNDFSSGIPSLLEGLTQPVLPPLRASWASRRKSEHFQMYRAVADAFTRVVDPIIGMDAWRITPLFHQCGEIDFMTGEGKACLQKNARILLQQMQAKYAQYTVASLSPPFAVVKSDTGTYGMSVMMVQASGELDRLNRKQRTRMASQKGGTAVRQAIIQEGVPSIETLVMSGQHYTAEPVIYMVDTQVVGGFYRYHPEKNASENLNTPGMQFHPFPLGGDAMEAMAEPIHYAYSVVARLALLAAARELDVLGVPIQ